MKQKYKFNKAGFNTIPPTLSRKIKLFLFKEEPIKIKIDLFLFYLSITVGKWNWLSFTISALQLIHFQFVNCGGAGWSIKLYKNYANGGPNIMLGIHISRAIIQIILGINDMYFIEKRMSWLICSMSEAKRKKLRDTSKEIEASLKRVKKKKKNIILNRKR